MTNFSLNWDKLLHEFDGNPFQERQPFPHVVVDGLWDGDLLRAAAAEFPPGDDRRWITYPDPKEYGKRAGDSRMWGPRVQDFFAYVRGDEVSQVLASLTGIGPLTADDIGGGMHMTGEGGRLETHVDFNIHPHNKTLERKLNVLVFLNEGWEKEWGGVLYLGKNREAEVIPTFNRTVIFATSEVSWHGHPEPVVGEHWRKSLACYYYAPRNQGTAAAHSTLWV